MRLRVARNSSVAEAEAAHWDENKDHDLPEQGEMRAGIHHDEPRHAGSGGRGEKRVKKAERLAVGSNGQHQKQRADERNAKKAQRKDPDRADAFMVSFVFQCLNHLAAYYITHFTKMRDKIRIRAAQSCFPAKTVIA